jgi:hypothetical protein
LHGHHSNDALKYDNTDWQVKLGKCLEKVLHQKKVCAAAIRKNHWQKHVSQISNIIFATTLKVKSFLAAFCSRHFERVSAPRPTPPVKNTRE